MVKKLLLSALLFCFLPLQGLFLQNAKAEDVNLISNPSVETVDPTTKGPLDWQSSSWGVNQSTFTYAKAGQDQSRCLRVTVRSNSSGDAKWFFKPVKVIPGQKYYFSDYYKSTFLTETVAAITDRDGAASYQYLGANATSLTWKKSEYTFLAPANADTLTIYHLIHSPGSLWTDNFVLKAVPDAVVTNGVPNNSLEQSAGSMPQEWTSGKWGTNTAKFSYLSEGHTGIHSVKTEITSYSSGDAKWYYSSQPVKPNSTYQFSDFYKSNIESSVVLAITTTSGDIVYLPLKGVPIASAWTQYKDIFTTPANAATITAFHLISAVGYVVTDDYSMTPYVVQGFSRGIVSVTLDDGWDSAYITAYPLLTKYIIPSTFYLVTDFLNEPQYLTVDEALKLKNAGNEIGSHTVSHPDLTTLTLSQLNFELSQSKTVLSGLFGPILNFASPYGAYNSNVITAIKQYYSSHRSVDAGFNSKDNFDAYNIKVQNVNFDTSPAQVQGWIDQAAQNKTWLVLVYHQIDLSGGAYSTTPSNFEAELSAIKNSGLASLTINQALSELVPQL